MRAALETETQFLSGSRLGKTRNPLHVVEQLLGRRPVMSRFLPDFLQYLPLNISHLA